MTTLGKLMSLADEYRNAGPYPFNATQKARQSLEAELRKLLTPLNDERLIEIRKSLGFGLIGYIDTARAIEAAHGITGGAE